MNKPLCKNLQNIDRNETGSLVDVSATEEEICWLRVWEKPHLEKTAFKDMYCKDSIHFDKHYRMNRVNNFN